MAISQIELQYNYSGKGPVDAKSLVKTFASLLQPATWYNNAGKVAAYNGMIVAVWLDPDATKNGVYLLHDPAITSILKTPDVSNVANWHKLAEMSELSAVANRLSAVETDFKSLEKRLSNLEENSDVLTYGYRSGFPKIGEANKLYIAADEQKSYVWFDDDYLPVSGEDGEEPEVIFGGTAD
jgi:hypothetical protein